MRIWPGSALRRRDGDLPLNFRFPRGAPEAESYEQLVKRRQQEVRNLQARPVQSLSKHWKILEVHGTCRQESVKMLQAGDEAT